MLNYRIDTSGTKQEELTLMSKKNGISTWRVYFDITSKKGDPEKRIEYIEKIEKDERGRDKVVVEEVEVDNMIYTAKFIEFTTSGDEIPQALDLIKGEAKKKIQEYDNSSAVNCFFFNSAALWLDKATRVGLMNSTSIQKAAGSEETVLWLNDTPIRVNVDKAIEFLSALEIYALGCYGKTSEHIKNIDEATTINEIVEYDYTLGYPDKLNIEL